MPAYAYPIKIKRQRQQVRFEEIVEIASDALTLSELQFVGDDAFSIDSTNSGDGCKITVYRSRSETVTERDARVAKEESYMAEFLKRKEAR